MNNIYFKYSPEEKLQFVTKEDVVSNYVDIHFGVIVDPITKIHAFSNVSYGYRLMKGQHVLSEDTWPKNSTKLIETSDEYFASHRVSTDESNLTIVLWVKDNGIVYRGSADIPALPPQPTDNLMKPGDYPNEIEV